MSWWWGIILLLLLLHFGGKLRSSKSSITCAEILIWVTSLLHESHTFHERRSGKRRTVQCPHFIDQKKREKKKNRHHLGALKRVSENWPTSTSHRSSPIVLLRQRNFHFLQVPTHIEQLLCIVGLASNLFQCHKWVGRPYVSLVDVSLCSVHKQAKVQLHLV